MAQCVIDYGQFIDASEGEIGVPTEADYIVHFTFCALRECCQNLAVPAIIPRVLLNNLALKISTGELEIAIPRHHNWAMEIFASIKSDLVPDFISKLKIGHLITD